MKRAPTSSYTPSGNNSHNNASSSSSAAAAGGNSNYSKRPKDIEGRLVDCHESTKTANTFLRRGGLFFTYFGVNCLYTYAHALYLALKTN